MLISVLEQTTIFSLVSFLPSFFRSSLRKIEKSKINFNDIIAKKEMCTNLNLSFRIKSIVFFVFKV